jgi:hypothetical protein
LALLDGRPFLEQALRQKAVDAGDEVDSVDRLHPADELQSRGNLLKGRGGDTNRGRRCLGGWGHLRAGSASDQTKGEDNG